MKELKTENACPCMCIETDLSKNECFFEADDFIGLCLLESIVFTNSYWMKKDWPDDAKKKTALFVNCGDVFMWGCADAEDIEYDEFEDLYAYYMKDKQWGVSVWCIKKRGMMPQKPVYESIMKQGVWNLDSMKLQKN